jgi:hypothetical protein
MAVPFVADYSNILEDILDFLVVVGGSTVENAAVGDQTLSVGVELGVGSTVPSSIRPVQAVVNRDAQTVIAESDRRDTQSRTERYEN